MRIFLNKALAEIKARRDAEGRELTRSDLYGAIVAELLPVSIENLIRRRFRFWLVKFPVPA